MRSPSNGNDIDGLKKGPWTPEEDQKLIDYIQKHGLISWQLLPKRAGLNRCGKSCRLRWTNYLRPDIKRGNFSPDEEKMIIDLHSVLGNKWSMIAARLPGRTDNEIKNFWNAHLRKRLLRSGIDPKTHQLITDLKVLLSLPPMLPTNSNLKSLMNTPLENFAKIQLLGNILQVLNTYPLLTSFGVSETLNRSSSIEPLSSGYQPVFESLGTIPELQDSKNNGIGSSTGKTNTVYWLPALVPNTPEVISCDHNQVHSAVKFTSDDNYDYIWGAVMDDEVLKY